MVLISVLIFSIIPSVWSAYSMNEILFLVEGFCNGQYDFRVPDDKWHPVFEYILENHNKLHFCKNKIHLLWTVNGGHLRHKVNDDNLLVQVLALTLPGYDGEGLVLYRGECRFLYEAGKIGFCWTPKIEVATNFARGLNSHPTGGALLKAYAPTSAIFSSPNSHSSEQMQEFEYTCNPYKLDNIQLLKYFPNFE